MQSKTIGIAVVALIIGGVIGYVVPHSAAAKAPTGFAGRTGAVGQFGRGGFTRGAAGTNGTNSGNVLTGTVVSVAGQDVTIKMPDGSSRLVLVTPNTTVSKSVTGSLSDVTSGSNVLVSGTSNSDGSLSADLIQLRPAGLGRFGTSSSAAAH